MILSLFLPQAIDGYVLLKKRILTISFSKNIISALHVTIQARTKTITGFIQEVIPYQQFETSDLAHSAALKNILKKSNSYDELILELPSSFVIFKELNVNLLDREKIAKIIGFELENYLLFPISNALYDFIITHQDTAAQKSSVFAAALPKDRADFYLRLFADISISVNRIIIDVLATYALYKRTQKAHSSEDEASFIITADDEKTTTLYLENNILKKIRVLSDLPEQNGDSWWKNIAFTFESCTENWTGSKKIIFYGNFSSAISEKTKVLLSQSCELIQTSTILQNISVKTAPALDLNIINPDLIGASLDLSLIQDFNLAPASHAMGSVRKIITQYITAGLLLLSIYGSLGIYAFFRIQKLSRETNKVKVAILKDLKNALPTLKATTPTEALRKSKDAIAKEESIWYSFSSQTKHSFLTYLFDLSSMLDRQTLGLELKKMIINKNGITLEGSVKSFDAVEEFLKQLKNTNLFAQIPNLQKTEFVMPLTLANQEGRS